MTKEEKYYNLTHETKKNLIENDLHLDIFINDKCSITRMLVALREYRLDVLINDKSDIVRQAVAYKGYGLDTLANDKCLWVKKMALKKIGKRGKNK